MEEEGGRVACSDGGGRWSPIKERERESEVVLVHGGTIIRELGDFEKRLLDAGDAILHCAVGRLVDLGEASWKSSEGGGG